MALAFVLFVASLRGLVAGALAALLPLAVALLGFLALFVWVLAVSAALALRRSRAA